MAISQDVKDRLLADYHTGIYSQRDLAKRYNVSNGAVSNLTKNVEKIRSINNLKIMDEDYPDAIVNKFNNRSGYVYLITAKEFNGLYKIGTTCDIRKRLDAMQVACPYELVLIHCAFCERALSVETGLHSIFSHKKIRGEWFRLSASDVSFIKGFKDGN